MVNEYCVYVHILISDGRMYVGKAAYRPGKYGLDRWRKDGKGYTNSGRKQNHFCNAISKFGWDNFMHLIIAKGLTNEEAQALEVELIEYFDTRNPENGFNTDIGGKGGSSKGRHFKKTKGLGKGARGPLGYKRKSCKRTEEWNANIGKAHRKKVRNKQTGEIYNSLKEASLAYGKTESYVGQCISAFKSGRTKSCIWEYI